MVREFCPTWAVDLADHHPGLRDHKPICGCLGHPGARPFNGVNRGVRPF